MVVVSIGYVHIMVVIDLMYSEKELLENIEKQLEAGHTADENQTWKKRMKKRIIQRVKLFEI